MASIIALALGYVAFHLVKHKDKLTTSSEARSYEELMVAFMRLQESSSVVENVAEVGAEEPKAHRKERMTARNVFDKMGSGIS